MNRTKARTVVFALIVAAVPPVAAQTPAAPQLPAATAPSPASPADAQPTTRAQGEGSHDADARHCLDLATNLEIIACAEKYRSHKTRR
jgi:hypothetical protein